MTQEENVIIPRWFLERIEDTLRIQYNINLDKKTGETCQDRNIKESLNGVRKLLKGEELTGGERLEKLQASIPSNLDEVAEEYGKKNSFCPDEWTSTKELAYLFSEAFKAGVKWMTGQGWTIDGEIKDYPTGGGDFEIYLDYNRDEMGDILDKICDYVNETFPNDENRYKVSIQIRKK